MGQRTIGIGIVVALTALSPLDVTSSVAAPTALADHAPGVVLVGFRPTATRNDRIAARAAARVISAEPLSPLDDDAEKWLLPSDADLGRVIAALDATPAVRYAEPDHLLTTAATSNDPFFSSGDLWGMYGDTSTPANAYGSQAAEAWTKGYTGSRTIAVGVIDEGIQITHPDLAANIWVNRLEKNGLAGIDDDGNGYVDDINGWDFANNDATVFDGAAVAGVDGHGTHVAGTIGGVGGNGAGVAGVNWSVTLVPGKFLAVDGGYTSDAVKAIRYMTDLKVRHGLNIVATSNSWVGSTFDQALLDAINDAGDRDILFVAAAGNAAADNDANPTYPAGYTCTTASRAWDCIISVAAIDSAGALAAFSNYGATKVDIGAPGVGIISTYPSDQYASANGTSMATPHVSGAVALCASLNPLLSASQLRTTLLGNVVATASLSGKVVTSGRLNADAVATACNSSANAMSGSPSGLAATATSATSIDLAWVDGASNEFQWVVQRTVSTSGTCGTYTTIDTLAPNATKYRDVGLTAATTYCYRVQAGGKGGTTSSWSNIATATTASPPLAYTCSPAPYSWLDPSIGGTNRTLGDDASTSALTLPFTVTYFGVDQTTVSVSSNGFIRFGSGAATASANTSLPNGNEPNNIVAAWWDDLDPTLGGTITTSTQGVAPNRTFVVSWANINPWGVNNPLSFQIAIDEATDAITFAYLDAVTSTGSNGATATVGLEDALGVTGTLISYNSPSISSATAYRCTDKPAPPPVTVTTSTLPSATVGVAYSQTFAASGGSGTYSWSHTAGSLPTNLALGTGGLLSGIPTTAGSPTFTVTATDTSAATGSKSFTVVVYNPIAISTGATLTGAGVGAFYTTTLAATGGTGSYSWWLSSGTIPPGLSLSSTGIVSGTPTSSGSFSFVAAVSDSEGRVTSRSFSISVAAAPGAFAKLSPKNNATKLKTSLALSWGAATNATGYEYCVTTSAPTAGQTTCGTAGWVAVSASVRSVTVALKSGTTYYWQVRARNGAAITNANTGTWWKFATA